MSEDEKYAEIGRRISDLFYRIEVVQENSAKAASFWRSVLSNIAANLVAAAILYLLAVLGGYIAANWIVVAAAILIVLPLVVYGVVRYRTSGGDSGNISNAKNTIIYAVYGLVLLLTSWPFARFGYMASSATVLIVLLSLLCAVVVVLVSLHFCLVSKDRRWVTGLAMSFVGPYGMMLASGMMTRLILS